MGPISIAEGLGALLALIWVWRAKDRTLHLMALLVFGGWAISMVAHSDLRLADRPYPFMLCDGVTFYVAGLAAVCRFDRPLWLYALVIDLAVECAAHVSYLLETPLIQEGHNYAALLNVCFAGQVLLLVLAPKHGDQIGLAPRRRLTTHL